MPDEMFFSTDMRSMRRGKRVSPRTEVCRPCLVWPEGQMDEGIRGVVMDVSPHGMRIRMMEALPPETPITIQMMRDDDFRIPLSDPAPGRIVRMENAPDGCTDHGIELTRKPVRRAPVKPVHIPRRATLRPAIRTRMYSIDYTVGGRRGSR